MRSPRLLLGALVVLVVGACAAPQEEATRRSHGDRDGGDAPPGDHDGACVPVCGARGCGRDPVCGVSCGTCTAPETCDAEGACVIPTSPDGPQILDVVLSPAVLTPSNPVTVTVLVTDPQGAADVVGGTLTTPTGDASYGAFAPTRAGGTFTLTVSWVEVHAAAPIQFGTAGGERLLRAVFYDEAGHAASRAVTLSLACPSASQGACDGLCVSLGSSASNCGACGREVSPLHCYEGAAVCPGGASTCGDACVDDFAFDPYHCGQCGRDCNVTGADENSGYCHEGRCSARFEVQERTSCNAVCGALGRQCEAGDYVWAWYDDTVNGWSDSYREANWGCATVPPARLSATRPFASLSCPCHEQGGASVCWPDCSGKVCGPDGCGGACGTCADGVTCLADGSACQFD